MLAFPFSPHPVIAAPDEETILGLVEKHGSRAAEMLRDIEQRRLELAEKMDSNRFEFGYVLPSWRRAAEVLDDPACTLLAIFGGNGAAKTVFSAWYAVGKMCEQPGFKVLFLHESEQSSINVHQKFVYDYLPLHWKPTEERRIKRGLTTKVNYSLADGFTNNKFVLPNAALAQFAFYGQQVGDYEGGGWNLIVADENLPLGWLKTLLYRLPRVQGKFLWTYSPIAGITPAVKHVVTGARTLESRRAELLPENHRAAELQDWPEGEMPTLQESVLPGGRILYFFSVDNPWAGYEQLAATLRGGSVLDTERRAYGYARNTVRAVFPLFGRVNIIPPAAVPAEVTRYLIMDPAGKRNFFLLWVAVDAAGRHYVYREWPDVATMGEWAEPADDSKLWDGKPGPAQATLGYGIVEYKRMILEAEGHRWDRDAGAFIAGDAAEEIFARYIDSRAGAAQSVAENDGGSSLMDRFAEEQLDHTGRVIGPAMELSPASGVREDEGLTAINDLLSYVPTRPIAAHVNEPHLYIVDGCGSTIWALQNYTGHDGEKAACKDPIDDLRYMATADLAHIETQQLAIRPGGAY